MTDIDDLKARIEELEVDLQRRDGQIKELCQERDQARELVDEMRERVEDGNALIDSWIEVLTRTQDIRIRLGGDPSLAEPFPDKPKGMWWRTYWRLRREAQEAEYWSWVGVAQRFGIVI